MRSAPLLEIQRAAAMRQPAHDELILTNQLLAVNTQILPFFMRTARDGQTPGDQRRSIFRPALHNGNFGQINRIAFQHFLLARRTAQAFGWHVQHLLKLRQLVEQIAEAFRWLWLFQKCQQLTHFTQRGNVFLPHPQCDTTRCTKQVAQHRHGVTFRIFKE